MTRVCLVCSPLGGSGKTVAARLLLEHAWRSKANAIGFDTNHLDPDLAHLFPDTTTVIDLSGTRGQMSLFDRLVADDGVTKVVDLWHANHELFWERAETLGFLREAQAQGVEVLLFLAADRKGRYAAEIQRLPVTGPNVTFVLINNRALTGQPKSDAARIALVVTRHVLIVPKVDVDAQRLLEEDASLSEITSSDSIPASRGPFHDVFDQLRFLDMSLEKAKNLAGEPSPGRVDT